MPLYDLQLTNRYSLSTASDPPLEEAPIDENNHEKGDTTDGCPFSQHGLEIDIAGGFAVLGRLGTERGRQGGHAWMTVSTAPSKHRATYDPDYPLARANPPCSWS